MSDRTWQAGLFLVAVAVAGVGFALGVIQHLDGPLLGGGDTSLWLHQRYYFSQNLSFSPLPTLDLDNDQLSYPYHLNTVYQPWLIEMHYLAWLAQAICGQGPWEQLYCLLSLLISAVATYLLLAKECSPGRAAFAAFAVSFCNFYAASRMPAQLCYLCIHWAVLSLLADALLVRRFVLRQRWPARLLALRIALWALCFGLDLGYICGIALTSTLLSAAYLVAVTLVRSLRGGERFADSWGTVLAGFWPGVRAHPVQVGLMVAVAAVAAFCYLPIVLQVAANARQFDFSPLTVGCWWAHPLRLLVPVLPGLDPAALTAILSDSPQSRFAAQPGLSLVLAGIASLFWGWRRLATVAPAMLLFALLVSFHPLHLPLLHHLPWFAFARVSGRFTALYPALLMVFTLAVPARRPRRCSETIVACTLCGLLVVETATAYGSYLLRPRWFFTPDQRLLDLLRLVRQTPGEALLEWPFCISAGNGIPAWPGRYNKVQGSTSALQAFHTKKIVGKYFGRLHPLQVRPYLEAGWPRMFFPTAAVTGKRPRQYRDFKPHEWRFLQDFFRLNDFCGILLYRDLVAEETVAGFHQRFGRPQAQARGAPFGRVEFIAKAPRWQGQADPQQGRGVSLELVAPPLSSGRRLSLAAPHSADYLVRGWSRPFADGRRSVASVSEIVFALADTSPGAGQAVTLSLSATAAGRRQIRIVLNGHQLWSGVHRGGPYRTYRLSLPARLLRLQNRLRLEIPANRRTSGTQCFDTATYGVKLAWIQVDRQRPPASSAQMAAATSVSSE